MPDASPGPIVVASCVDAGYLPLALVVASSIARHADPQRAVEYHVLYDGPDHWAVDMLGAFAKGPVTVRLHRLTNPWNRFGVINGFPPSTFFRFAVPDVLAGYERAIYLDCDLIVEADLEPLFDTDMHGHPIGAVPCVLTIAAALRNGVARSGGECIRAADYFRDVLGLDTEERVLSYRQCGVQLLDLAALRRMDYAGEITKIVDRLGDRLAYCDQCAANLLLRERFADIDPRWNIAPYAMHRPAPDNVPPQLRQLLQRQQHVRGIVHFGGEKPWSDLLMPGALRWWGYALTSPGARYFLARLVGVRPNLRIGLRHLSYSIPALRRLADWLRTRARKAS